LEALAENAAYTLSDGTDTFPITTDDSEATSPVDAEPASVCVEVASEYNGDCTGTTFTLDLPALDAGFYVAELTDESGASYRVLGDRDGVRPYRGLCSSTLIDASGWESAEVRVAVVATSGELGPWSATWSGDMPLGGSKCLIRTQEEEACGCASGSAPYGIGALVALLAVARRR
jgi:MYXO-CTERM domain-containing protein